MAHAKKEICILFDCVLEFIDHFKFCIAHKNKRLSNQWHKPITSRQEYDLKRNIILEMGNTIQKKTVAVEKM